MKKLLFFFIFFSSFAFSQMPNIAEVWMNKSKPYTGTIGGKETINGPTQVIQPFSLKTI